MNKHRSLTRTFAALAMLALSSAAAVAGTTSWSASMGGDIRLISAGDQQVPAGALAAGLQLRLKKGWKTYWRFPGDSGIPTTADFSGSINLASADLAFPAPQRYFDGYSTSIGYQGEVVLPIAVRPVDPAMPVFVNVTVSYGVCAAICVPVEDDLSLVMSASGPPDEAAAGLIARAQARVPRPAFPGDRLSVLSVSLDDQQPRNFTFTAKLGTPKAPTDLFVEGPEGSYLSVPTLQAIDGEIATWTLPLDGLVHEGDSASLRLTLVNGSTAIEQEWPLSASDLD